MTTFVKSGYNDRGLVDVVGSPTYAVAEVYESTSENLFLRRGELCRLAVAVNAVEFVVEPRPRLAKIAFCEV